MRNHQRSTKLYIALLGIFALSLNACQGPTGDLLITNVTIIDASNGAQTEQSVLINNDRITHIYSTSEQPKIKAKTTIDGSGKYLIPGLWDAHVHMSYETDLSPAMFDLFMVNGITSIRDTGGQMHLVTPWKKLSKAHPKTTPRLMIAGPLIDGHPTVYNGENGRPNLGITAMNPDAADSLVRLFAAGGADLLKSYEMLSPETYKALMAASKAVKLPVTGHVPLSMDVISASNEGLRSMEHMRNLEFSTSKDSDSLLRVRKELLTDGVNDIGGTLRSTIHAAQRTHAIKTQDPDLTANVLKALDENDTWQVPTLTISISSVERFFSREAWKDYFKYLPDSVESRWRKLEAQIAALPIDEDRKLYRDWALGMIKKLDEADVEMMAGTDTPIFLLTPGYSLHEELSLLVKGGLTPLQAIEAATLRPAQYFHLENKLGIIAPEYIADLVLLNENPLEDITNTRSVEAVIKDGNLMTRNDLDEILSKLEAK